MTQRPGLGVLDGQVDPRRSPRPHMLRSCAMPWDSSSREGSTLARLVHFVYGHHGTAV